MGQDLINGAEAAHHGSRAVGTATRCSIATLAAAIPAWVDHHALDASLPHGYGMPVPAGSAPALRDAAMAHAAALTPSTPDERHRLLLGLRSGTIIRDEDADEADATLKLLRVHLDDVPLDILQAACRAYCNAPGRRFFPKSAGELRTFINPMLYERRARAMRLNRLAEQAEREDARAAELAADPLTADGMREILAAARLKPSTMVSITPGALAA
ncbi:hypothetical protein [Sphingomonas rubra]|uniref:Uncharacterized protein n=1 Tax=Sphingomonas rubra TaxID=634430 RepID=A0A1I5RV54_9SPHN|nr:hypothetical protein [Sphingomonas rubra]SFP62384.1 hypothetical protein SAMN04488241_104149 [Sphingomonas rubra]